MTLLLTMSADQNRRSSLVSRASHFSWQNVLEFLARHGGKRETRASIRRLSSADQWHISWRNQ